MLYIVGVALDNTVAFILLYLSAMFYYTTTLLIQYVKYLVVIEGEVQYKTKIEKITIRLTSSNTIYLYSWVNFSWYSTI